MLTQTTITAPDGYQIDPIALKNNKIEFIPIKHELPQSWEELNSISGWFMDDNSNFKIGVGNFACEVSNRNILPTAELAEAMLALCQLLQLRDRYNNGWKPDWCDNSNNFIIEVYNSEINTNFYCKTQRVLAFKTAELRDTFFTAPKIRELIEIAKPLL